MSLGSLVVGVLGRVLEGSGCISVCAVDANMVAMRCVEGGDTEGVGYLRTKPRGRAGVMERGWWRVG